jgi:hypothetical protein
LRILVSNVTLRTRFTKDLRETLARIGCFSFAGLAFDERMLRAIADQSFEYPIPKELFRFSRQDWER